MKKALMLLLVAGLSGCASQTPAPVVAVLLPPNPE